MNLFQNASPRLVLTGFDDRSVRAPLPEAEPLPIHLPLFFTFAEMGPEGAHLVSGNSLLRLYGDNTVNYRSPFAKHVTPFIREVNAAGNAIFIHRLKPEGAATASISFSLDILPKTLPVYEREDDGSYKLANGERIETSDTVEGFVARWVIEPVTGAVGTETQRAGSMSEAGVQSTIYPIFNVPASFFGSYGNGLGIRFSAPTTQGLEPIDDEMAIGQGSYFYRMEVVRRPEPRSSAVTVRTISSERMVEFSLKPGAINPNFETDLFVDEVVMKAYRDLEDFSTGVPLYGPFDNFYVYHDNVQAVSEMIFNAEQPLSELPEGEGNEYLINLFSATNLDGSPYHAFMLYGALDNAPELTELATHYLSGGDDGDLSDEAFDLAVRQQLDFFGELDVHYEDMARYPISAFYDSGFSLQTKRSIGKILSVRKDVHVAVATQDVSLPPLSISEESSMAVALRAALRLHPESTIHGTPACRGVVMGHSGRLIGSEWTKLVPGTLELAIKRARYLGAGDGVMRGPFSYDEDPNNHVQFIREINNTWKPQGVRNRDWANGLVWAQYYDRTRLFFPAFQTVYDNDTSVLNSDLNMQIATELNKVCHRVWRELVGNTKLTNEQFIERSNEKIVEYTRDRFDGRVVIVPDTFYTPADEARGFSWHCRIHMYANVMKTVSIATVVTHRLEDLA